MATGDFDVNRIVGERNALKGLLDESLRQEATRRAENAALREEVKALKGNRWADDAFTDDELGDVLRGLLYIDRNHPNAFQVREELKRREASHEQ